MSRQLEVQRVEAANAPMTAAWDDYEIAADAWDSILASVASDAVRPGVGGLWVVEACTETCRVRRDRLTVILHEVVPVHVTAAGDRICGRLYAAEPQSVSGGRLRLELLVGPAWRDGAGSVAEGMMSLGAVEQPFDAFGEARIDVPVSVLGGPAVLRTTCRRWPSHLRRLTVVVPERLAIVG